MAKLKLFRTAIGFHDAYVAAPSRKAALEAWGADADLFARGMAEQVAEDGPGTAALDSPGSVIKVIRGSAADHLRALPADAAPTQRKRAGSADTDAPAKARTDKTGEKKSNRKRASAQRPSRVRVDAAQEAIDALDVKEREALAAIRREEAALADRRRQTEADFDRKRVELVARRDTAQAAYRRAMEAWRDA